MLLPFARRDRVRIFTSPYGSSPFKKRITSHKLRSPYEKDEARRGKFGTPAGLSNVTDFAEARDDMRAFDQTFKNSPKFAFESGVGDVIDSFFSFGPFPRVLPRSAHMLLAARILLLRPTSALDLFASTQLELDLKPTNQSLLAGQRSRHQGVCMM